MDPDGKIKSVGKYEKSYHVGLWVKYQRFTAEIVKDYSGNDSDENILDYEGIWFADTCQCSRRDASNNGYYSS